MDNIRPSHYKLCVNGIDIEVKDIMQGMSLYEYRAFCKMNAIKYLLRADNKNKVEDYEKCIFYINEIIRIDSEGRIEGV